MMLQHEACEERTGNLSVRFAEWCLLLGLFSLICGAKMWAIYYFGNATPFRDEWDMEAPLIKGYLEGSLSLMQFFALQNEHRLAFTRMFILLLFSANRQWDPILQMVAQAPLHALTIVLFVSRAGKFMSACGKAALAGFAACMGMVPFGWDNTLAGEGEAFYFAVLFGIAVIWLCWRHEPLTFRWWLGALIAFASLFTMASGVFPVVVVTAFLVARLFAEQGKQKIRRIAGIAILAAIAAFGVAITPRGLHPGDVAANIKAFLWAFTGILSWPCGFHWACLFVQAPLIALTVLCVARRIPFSDGRWFAIIVGATFWLESAVTAYVRCKDWDASRYSDTWGILSLALCACLYFLNDCLGKRLRPLFYPIVALWLLVFLYGTLDNAINLLPTQLLQKRQTMVEMENNLRGYLRTGDATYLNGKIPYPRADVLEKRLSSNTIRQVLPSNLLNPNPPLAVNIQQNLEDGFVQNGCPDEIAASGLPIYGSYGKNRAKTQADGTFKIDVPKGTHEIELQVAGYPGAPGMSLTVKESHLPKYNIAPPVDPGLLWDTVSFHLKTNGTSFKINATDNSQWAWLAFSAPHVSNQHTLSRWADTLAERFLEMLVIGSVLMLAGALLTAGRVSQS